MALWLAAWPLMVAALIFPIRFEMLRGAMILGVLWLWTGAVTLFWRRIAVRVPCLLVGASAVILTAWPGRAADPADLREQYTNSLCHYLGVTYIWGGENGVGIDCSGLVRIGMIDACYRRAHATGNPALLRAGIDLWWHDCSARALGEGYRGQTRLVLQTRSLNVLDYSRIRPGDIAVTAGGDHVMAYLGGRTWIEADPKAGRVITESAPSASNGWFRIPMRILRWRILEG